MALFTKDDNFTINRIQNSEKEKQLDTEDLTSHNNNNNNKDNLLEMSDNLLTCSPHDAKGAAYSLLIFLRMSIHRKELLCVLVLLCSRSCAMVVVLDKRCSS